MSIKGILILAAGKGERMRVAFPDLPKPLVPIDRIPMIFRILRACSDSRIRFESILIVVRPKDLRLFLDVFQQQAKTWSFLEQVRFLTQDQDLDGKGTAAAVHAFTRTMMKEKEQHKDDDWWLVLNSDTPLLTGSSLYSFVHKMTVQQQPSHHCAGFVAVVVPDPTGYGRVLYHNNHWKIIEEMDTTTETSVIQIVNAGIYLFRTSLLRQVNRLIPSTVNGETRLPDLLEWGGENVGIYQEFPVHETRNINTPMERITVELEILRKKTVVANRE